MKNKTTMLECPSCKTSCSKNMQKRVCISKHPDLRESILNGSFFEWKCPGCQERFFIEDVFLYNDDQRKFMVYLISGYDKRIQKIPTQLKVDDAYDTGNSLLRVTASFVDFVEKIRILEAELDDRIVETMKAVYAQVYYQNHKMVIYNMIFEQLNEDKSLCFAVFLEDKDFVVDIPYEAYKQAYGDFSPLIKEPTEHAFIMIDQTWLVQLLKNNNFAN